MDEELKAYLTEMKREMTEIKSVFAEIKSELIKHSEPVETRRFDALSKWARTADLRYRQGDATVGFLNDRLQAIEDRVFELERRRPR